MLRFRLVPPVALVLCLVAPFTAWAVEAPGTAPVVDAALAREVADAPSLHLKRVGVSEPEPDYCREELYRETNVNAANRDSIEIGPPKFLVEDLDESLTWRHCISILNRFSEPKVIKLSTLDLRGSPDPNVIIEFDDRATGAGSWVELPITRIELNPGERALVPYLLRLPSQPPGGTVIAGIRVVDVTGIESQGGARISKSLIAQVQVTSPGGEAKRLDIRNVTSTRFIWTGRDPGVIRTSFTALNTGTVVDTMEPRLVIDGLFGREVATIKGTPDVVIPESAQRTTLRWDGVPFIGLYFPELRVKSRTGTTVEDLPMVVVLPPRPYVIAVVVALLLLAFGFWRRRRDDWRRYLDDDDEADIPDWEDEQGPYGDH